MPRAPATTDVFNAVAEPRRRAIIGLLAARGVLHVSAIVAALALPQPSVSKHLSVLREVGLVSVERVGQQRLYRLKADELRTIYDWLKNYEHMWTHQLDRIKQRAEQVHRQSRTGTNPRHA